MDKLGITVFDVAVIAVACFGALLGASAGFAHAVLFIGSWIVAGWAAWKYAKLIQPEVEQLVGSTERDRALVSITSTIRAATKTASMARK